MTSSVRTGRKTLDEIRTLARENDMPSPDGYLSSGQGGVHLGRNVVIVEVKSTNDPGLIKAADRERAGAVELGAGKGSFSKIVGRVVSGTRLISSLL